MTESQVYAIRRFMSVTDMKPIIAYIMHHSGRTLEEIKETLYFSHPEATEDQIRGEISLVDKDIMALANKPLTAEVEREGD